MLELQAEANNIDSKISTKEREKAIYENSLRESSAFPNSSAVTPDIILNFIKNSSNSSKEVKDLEKFIHTEHENINFQDIHKFIVNQHLRKISDENVENLFDYPTKYVVEGTDGEGRGLEENSFEEKYFSEVAKRRERYFRVDYPEKSSTRNRVKDCCCIVV